MKNKSLLIVSFLLIAFLIGTSYAPSGMSQTVMAQESDPYEGLMDLPEFDGKGTLITGTKEEMYQQQDSLAVYTQRYIVPGFAFKRANDKSASDTGTLNQGVFTQGRARYINEDMEKYVELHYPVQIPEDSMIHRIEVCGSIVYRVEPHQKLTASLFRYYWSTGTMETIAQVSLSYQTDGDCIVFILDEPHIFNPLMWNYQLVVPLYASYAQKNAYTLSQVILHYAPPSVTLFPLAFPAIQK